MICALAFGLLLLLLYILSMMCRSGNKGLADLRGWAYAHRGLHGHGVPENSMAAFQKAVDAGYGIELDVHLLADGNLAVMHDSSLMRTSGINRIIEEMTTDELNSCFLEGTREVVPTFDQVLRVVDGKVPLIIEIKPKAGNFAALTERVCQRLESYDGVYCIESFDPHCVFWLRRNRPDIIRGQLSFNYLKQKNAKLPWIMRFLLTHQMLNFLTYPDFVAYRCTDRKHLSNAICRKIWGAVGVSWTLLDPEDYRRAVQDGWIPIFEGFQP